MTERAQYNKLLYRYRRYLRRLRRIDQGDSGSIGPTKNRQWLLEALEKLYYRLLRLRKKILIISSAAAVSFLISTNPLYAQCAKLEYTEITGGSNPMNGEDIGSYSTPYFVDIDNDGDQDLFLGEFSGTFFYYENTGSASSATFVQRTGAANPLNGFDVGSFSTPAFVDIDNDGDFDMFAGETGANFNYFENTGTAASPTFVQRTGAANPLNGASVGSRWSAPFFVDIDNDGDFDMFSGDEYGGIFHWENTGTAGSPTFVQRTGGANPLNTVNLAQYTAPTFVDVDNDGDFDSVIGDSSGDTFYFENTGTAAAATFTPRTGSSNPFNGDNVGFCSAPTLVDIDNDGDFDIFIGEFVGNVNFFELSEITVKATFDLVEEATDDPLSGEDIGSRSAPDFVDIDNDGDFDMFAGETAGIVNYYENTGTASAPTFVQRTGASNPMNGYDVGLRSTPDFVDIDNDGDFDLFVGEQAGITNYYENTGTASAPTFVQRTGGSNPMNGFDIGNRSDPEFVDIDNDGDFDVFVGEENGNINYFENTGTAGAPTFVVRTGANNPFNGVDVGTNSSPAATDLDSDGDFDVYIGDSNGNFNFFENTGTAGSPTFTSVTGNNDPLDGVDVGSAAKPSFVDIDNDMDPDMFSGEFDGNFNFFENICPASILPIELVFFRAQVEGQEVILTWQTASEINNDFFTILRSTDAQDWEGIEQIKAPEGDSFELLDYHTVDSSPIFGRSFYRLKQTDFDGQFSFSDIESVTVVPPTGTISAFPNPISDFLTLHITTNSSQTKEAVLEIFDLSGRTLMRTKNQLTKGYNPFRLNLSTLRPGTYLLKVTVNQGNTFTNKIIKR